jgi:hypothetical protein
MRVCGTQSSTVHGYASVRYQIEKGLVLPDDIVEKYIKQFMAARRRHESLREECDENGNVENILCYLDWREEIALRGASAIYFLYQPLPVSNLQRLGWDKKTETLQGSASGTLAKSAGGRKSFAQRSRLQTKSRA